jgi:predicted membrane protein
MNKKYLSALVCGFGAAVLTTIPGIESIACCTLVPVAAGLSIFVYKKSQPDLAKITTGTGIFIGVLTGVIAALFASGLEIIITYITRTSDIVVSLPQAEQVVRDMNFGPAAEESFKLLKLMVEEIQTQGFSLLYTLLITISNLITYSIFGLLGGIIGTALINKRNR